MYFNHHESKPRIDFLVQGLETPAFWIGIHVFLSNKKISRIRTGFGVIKSLEPNDHPDQTDLQKTAQKIVTISFFIPYFENFYSEVSS